VPAAFECHRLGKRYGATLALAAGLGDVHQDAEPHDDLAGLAVQVALHRVAGQGGDADLQAVVEGIQYSIRAFDSLIPLDGKFERIWPPKNITAPEDLKEFARNEAWGHHASCTCPIGADDDPLAVLDSEFRVRGVDGLRVVDASVFPKIPGFYVALPTYMMSEKAAEVIIQRAASK
jgi:choline dehydrogenase